MTTHNHAQSQYRVFCVPSKQVQPALSACSNSLYMNERMQKQLGYARRVALPARCLGSIP